MANTAYSTLVQDIQAFVYGCPQPVIVNALRLAAIQFCRESEAYKYRPALINIVATQSAYTLTLPTDTEVHRYVRVLNQGGEVTFKDYDAVLVSDPAFPSLTGTPANYTYQQDLSSFYLVPVPDTSVSSAVQVVLVLRPTIVSTGLDSIFMARYKTALVHGAVSRLCLMDKMVWADAKKAALHNSWFRNGIADAAQEARSDYGNVAPVVSIRKFR